MTIAINDVIRIQARMLRNGVDAVQNVYHVHHDSGAPVTDATWVSDVSALIDAEMFTLRTQFATNITSLDLLFFNITQDVTLPDGAWATFVAGTAAGDANPPQVSAMVFWRTAAARVIGRKFLPPFVEINQSDGNWTVGALTALAVFAVNLIGSIVISQGNISFGVFNAVTATFNAYATALVPIDARTQRRRRTGVGA